MAISTEPKQILQAPEYSLQGRTLRPFTTGDYSRMAETGIIHPGERTELIEGVIISMSPPGNLHIGRVNTLTYLLVNASKGNAVVSVQNPLHISQYSQPQPDVAFLTYRKDFYGNSLARPEDVLLLIEVSDSTLSSDRSQKVPLYAEANIPVFWIVDIQKEAIEVYTLPADGQYNKIERLGRGQSLEVPGFPGVTLQVDDILGS